MVGRCLVVLRTTRSGEVKGEGMKLSVENGNVLCSLENKNGGFLWACYGLFDGFLSGKLKMYWDNPEEFRNPDTATLFKAERLEDILRYAKKYGVEADETVTTFNLELQTKVTHIKACRLVELKYLQQCERWERLCKSGCGKCQNLAYDIDLPICKQTGLILEEKNVGKYIGGVLHLFNLEPFPSEECPFNINKKQGATNERISEACGSKIQT